MACSLMKRGFFQKARYHTNTGEQPHQIPRIFGRQELSLVNAIKRYVLYISF